MFQTYIKPILDLITSVFNFQSKRSDLNNAPDIKDRKIKQEEVNFKSDVVKTIQNQDVKKTQNLLSD